MKYIQESKKEDVRIMDSFIKKVSLFLVLVFLLPVFGALGQNQDNMKKSKTDTTKTTKTTTKKTTKTNMYSDTARTKTYDQQNMNMQNQNQNQQNRNRYDNQKGDTLQTDQSHDAVLIENNPKK